jgi:hypothetical protein
MADPHERVVLAEVGEERDWSRGHAANLTPRSELRDLNADDARPVVGPSVRGVSEVRKVEIDPGWLIFGALDRIDFQDAFAIDVDPSLPSDPKWWADQMLANPPKSVAALMATRNLAMKPFGLKTGELDESGENEVFKPLAQNESELLVGTDDRHLNFRGNLVTESSPGKLTLTIGTVVKFNNRFGRAYFVPVRPMHAYVIVPMMLRHLERTTRP